MSRYQPDQSEGFVSAAASCPGTDRSFYSIYGKRALDISLGLLVLPLVLPMIGLLWLIVRLDGGPGFYGSMRLGRNGKTYTCWKIRTMVADADKRLPNLIEKCAERSSEYERFHKLENDPRVTRVGRFLRMTSLDELPQIWNVLKGEMSLVGPRPFAPEGPDLAAYRRHGYSFLDELKPGITGIMQVSGRHKVPLDERMKMHVQYVRTMSLGLDLLLILRTVKVLFSLSGK